MQSDLKPCPLCGALPCDWVDDPHKMEVGLCWTLAQIRQVLGVNEKPMLDELPKIIAEALTERASMAAEIERLRGIVRGWHYLAVGPDEMGDYYTHKQLIKLSEPYASPSLAALDHRP